MTDLLAIVFAATALAYIWAGQLARDTETIVHPELAAIFASAVAYVVSRFFALVFLALLIVEVLS